MSRFQELADAEFELGFPTAESADALRDELFFQRAVQAYLWSLPAINIWAMKEGSERTFGAGNTVLPIWQKRIDAKTLVTTPNTDVLYAMGYLDLADGPLVIQSPPGILGILDDFWQRPVHGPVIDGHLWKGDVGHAGPDQGKGGTFVLLGPSFEGEEPEDGYVYRSRTRNVFLFWRAFFKDPDDLDEPVATIKKTVIHRLGEEPDPEAMSFPEASGVPCDMLFPRDGAYFEMLDRFVQNEAVDPMDLDLRGFLHTIGIEKGKAFDPTPADREILDAAARAAFKISKVTIGNLVPLEPGGTYFEGRPWINTFAGEDTEFRSTGTFTNLEQRTGFFTAAYSDSPAMVENFVGTGAKYPATLRDSEGRPLDGGATYTLRLPADIPARLFWSVAVYDALTASGLDNGQPFPSINTMDKPVFNEDGTIDFRFGPDDPGEGANWIRTVPGAGYFVILRLYGPEQPFFDQTWVPGEMERQG